MSHDRNQSSSPSRKRTIGIAAPILVTAVGVGWLLTVQKIIPGVEWAWVLLLAALGGVVLFLEGLNRFSFVVGPALIVGAALSMLRQINVLSVDTEVPLLTITIGGLWTLAHLLPLPRPVWIVGD